MTPRISIAIAAAALGLACGGGSVTGHPDAKSEAVNLDAFVPDWETLAANACSECATDEDCAGGVCVKIGGDNRCTYPCPDTAACPPSFMCVTLNEAQADVCYPMSADCTCTYANDGETADCENVNDYGECKGQAVCGAQDGWLCDAQMPEAEKCDYEDNDCDGLTDEDFLVGGLIVDDANCSLCGFSCIDLFENGTGRCTTEGTLDPHCELAVCDEGYQPFEGGCAPVSVLPLCTPCEGSNDCDGGECVLLEGEGGVCTWACDEKPCPDGYLCTDNDGPSYCLPPTGSCECTPENLGLTRPCSIENVFGICFGKETCGTDGFTGCSAKVPLAEDCNGKDDDCDGLVDEDLDAPACNVGACVGEMACEGLDGWVCVAPSPKPEVCDYEDNDCDGVADNGFVDPATGLYFMDQHCGGCGNDCGLIDYPNSHGECRVDGGVADCAMVCEAGFVDLDKVEEDGCECVFLGPDDPPNGVDENCDGIDGEPDNAVFVASWGSDSNPGTPDKPLRNIGKGLDAAVVKSLGYVYVAAGTYEGPVTLAAGKGVYGGFDEDFSVHEPSTFQSIVQRKGCDQEPPGTVNAICADGALKASFSGFVVEGPVCTSPGASSYALYVRGCGEGLQIMNNEFRGGEGGPGEAGGNGDKGSDGKSGKNGEAAADMGSPYCYPSFPTAGGDGGQFQCGSKPVDGGDGGDGACPDFDEQYDPDVCPVDGSQYPKPEEYGQDGLPAGKGGAGGTPGYDSLITTYFFDPYSAECSTPQWACTACQLSGFDTYGTKGEDGGAGSPGNGGAGCSDSLGVVVAGLWKGSAGSAGTQAGSGAGGGGGGAGGGVETAAGCSNQALLGLGYSDFGGSGGGGGSGACGGSGGFGGQSGGAAFAVFMTWDQAPDTLPSLGDNVVVTGTGGAGGSGGAGGLGGVGGHGGSGGEPGGDETTWCARGGRDGGNGGNGGHGGGGGGGCGGPSVGVFVNLAPGQVPQGYAVNGNEIVLKGSGGSGGAGGKLPVSGGPDGLPGQDGSHLATNF